MYCTQWFCATIIAHTCLCWSLIGNSTYVRPYYIQWHGTGPLVLKRNSMPSFGKFCPENTVFHMKRFVALYARLITYFGNFVFGFSVQYFPFARQDGQDEMKN